MAAARRLPAARQLPGGSARRFQRQRPRRPQPLPARTRLHRQQGQEGACEAGGASHVWGALGGLGVGCARSCACARRKRRLREAERERLIACCARQQDCLLCASWMRHAAAHASPAGQLLQLRSMCSRLLYACLALHWLPLPEPAPTWQAGLLGSKGARFAAARRTCTCGGAGAGDALSAPGRERQMTKCLHQQAILEGYTLGLPTCWIGSCLRLQGGLAAAAPAHHAVPPAGEARRFDRAMPAPPGSCTAICQGIILPSLLVTAPAAHHSHRRSSDAGSSGGGFRRRLAWAAGGRRGRAPASNATVSSSGDFSKPQHARSAAFARPANPSPPDNSRDAAALVLPCGAGGRHQQRKCTKTGRRNRGELPIPPARLAP